MISYRKHILDNGLTLLVMEDHSTPLVSVNTLFRVGARNENPHRTGFAHLFEHLMFGGTPRVPDFDRVVNSIGGESNAMTNNDFTNYYLTVPSRHLETALMLEADRMRGIDLSEKSLRVQQSVVTEEYHYRYVNQPYGDVWMLLRPLCYKQHPYRWCTIGSDIRHVQEATLDDVQNFFDRYYLPDNAILAIAGNVDTDETVALVRKYYGNISCNSKEIPDKGLNEVPMEPEQTEARSLSVERQVPSDAIYIAYPMSGRLDPDFRATDLISDILSNGKSTRLYNELVKSQGLFTEIDAYITGEIDPGLFVVSGKTGEGVDLQKARMAVEEQLQLLVEEVVSEQELEKVKNRYETTFAFSQYKALDCAMALCYYDMLGHTEWINTEPSLYREVAPGDIKRVAQGLFKPEHQSVLYYKRGIVQ